MVNAVSSKSPTTTNIARHGIISFAVITLVGVVVAAAVLAFALSHDALGEFHDDSGVRWDFLLVTGGVLVFCFNRYSLFHRVGRYCG
jgi:hypothetical protein